MKDPPGIIPSKGNQGTTQGKEKILLTSVGIEPTTSGLDLPLLWSLKAHKGWLLKQFQKVSVQYPWHDFIWQKAFLVYISQQLELKEFLQNHDVIV